MDFMKIRGISEDSRHTAGEIEIKRTKVSVTSWTSVGRRLTCAHRNNSNGAYIERAFFLSVHSRVLEGRQG